MTSHPLNLLVAQIGENSVLNLDCSEKYLVIEGAKYWAPDGILCLELPDAFQLTRDHCDLKVCSRHHQRNKFCWMYIIIDVYYEDQLSFEDEIRRDIL